ncbi:MAG TPA: hypothetical protein VKF59_10445 [Candidatus Dormibacteraeota bacterium]|nr:hypothetical protein [Candidatus Dormibacteraeota bacterium]
MGGYGQMCPIAPASEIFAERYTPLTLREILAGSSHFSEIQQGRHRGHRPGVPPGARM